MEETKVSVAGKAAAAEVGAAFDRWLAARMQEEREQARARLLDWLSSSERHRAIIARLLLEGKLARSERASALKLAADFDRDIAELKEALGDGGRE